MTRIFVYEYLSGGGDMATTAASGAADGLLAMGQAMRDAMAADLLALKSYHVSVATCKLAAPPAQTAHPVMPHEGESAQDFVRRQAQAHDLAWVVAPESEGLLAGLHPCVPPQRWLGCSLPAISIATHKRRTLAALARAGVATPLDFEQRPDIDRWVVKPADGAGAVATRVHRKRSTAWEDWRSRSGAGQPAVIEPWIDGDALSLSLMCGPGRCELLSINRQHIRVDGQGLLSYVGVQVNAVPLTDPHARQLAALAARVQQAIPGLRGFVGIDLVRHPRHGPVAIEVNPRVTCAYVGLSQALGRNLAADVIASCHDEPSLEVAHGDA
ncbi:ATP-grasp domain-containing protein [Variovorax sp. OV329]|uniref:ATP-grasp domain-containing protein n=1 Tax=Variovorax sp. OV329 TaxID=1882825 RepID=UPI0008F410D9|nr:ATP-grasp domain-containing protein [Variovorax sp. OV329]SFL95285.1 Predicted ATP-dependent carboligase, ATP-grasp superfamily [Variovorax sp. OV329]